MYALCRTRAKTRLVRRPDVIFSYTLEKWDTREKNIIISTAQVGYDNKLGGQFEKKVTGQGEASMMKVTD